MLPHAGFAATCSVLMLAASQQTPPTFSSEIAPIIYQNCTECHRPNGGAPFPFTSYDEVKSRSRLIAHVTGTRLMPPWKAEPQERRFKHERRLTEEQIAALQAWHDAGAPLGDPDAVPPPPVFSSEWHHGEPDLIIEMEEDFIVPADGPDIYRNFVIRIPDLPPGKYLAGVDYKPRAVNTAHHALFGMDATGYLRRADEMDTHPGFGGMEANLASGRIAGWAVGALPDLFPEGVSVPVPPGSDMVIYAHFHPSGKEEIERARLGLYLTDRPPVKQMYPLEIPFGFGITANINIPAGEPHYVVTERFTLPQTVEVSGITPHAHMIAKEIQAIAHLPGGEPLSLIHVRNWDFAWQEQYRYEEILTLPAGTEIEARFIYDNSAENPRNPHHPPKRITWGPESTDEMACVTLRVMTDTPEQMAALKKGYGDWVKQAFTKTDFNLIARSVGKQERGRADLNHDGKISWDERLAMIRRFRDRLRGDNLDELGIIPFVVGHLIKTELLPFLLPRLVGFILLVALLIWGLHRWRHRRANVRHAAG